MKELTLTANGQEIKVYAEESELAKLIEKTERVRTGYERVEEGGSYFVRGRNVSPIKVESGHLTDNRYFACGDYVNDEKLFKDRDRAEELHNRLEQWQALNDEPVDWGNGIFCKCKITFDYSRMFLFADNNTSSSYRDANVVYFSSKEKAQEAIEVFRDELLWYFTEYRSRLDEIWTEAAEK